MVKHEPTHLLHLSSSRATKATIAGQAIGAAGIAVQWAAAPELFGDFPFPPGLVFIAGAAAVGWLGRRRPWSSLAAVLLSAWILFGGLAGGDLVDNLTSSNPLLVGGNAVMVLGLAFSAAAGGIALAHSRRNRMEAPVKPLSPNNPHRRAVIVMIAGLVADAVGDGAPEGLNWDGPGPLLFLVLAALVASVPGRFVIALGTLVSGAFVVGVFGNPEPMERLTTPSDPVGFGFTALQLAGLLLAVAGGTAALLPLRNRKSPEPLRAEGEPSGSLR